MFSAHIFNPLSSALAAETATRVGGSSHRIGEPDMALQTASVPIYRGALR